jgi:long-chain acyl-CoA synthetase
VTGPLTPAAALAQLTAADGAFPLVQVTSQGRTVTAYDIPERTLRDVLLASVAAHGERSAVEYHGERWTYAMLADEAGRVARRLQDDYDVGPGSRVGLAMRNYPEWPVVFWAVQLAGAVAVPYNAWLAPGELTALVQASQPVVLFADVERASALHRDGDVPLPVVLVRGDDAAPTDDAIGARPYAELVRAADGSGRGPRPVETTADDAATLLYTSGTTGRPRGVLASHRSHLTTLTSMRLRTAVSRMVAGLDPTTPSGPLLLTYPLFHVAGLTALTAAHASGRSVSLLYRWDLDQARAVVDREQAVEIGGAPLVGRQVVDLAALDPLAFRTLTSLGFGGAPTPPHYIADVQRVFAGRVSAKTGYGSTETTSAVVSIAGDEYVAHPDSVGRALPGVEVRLVDEEPSPVPGRRRGVVAFRGAQVCAGYLDRPDDPAFDDGWFVTSDVVDLDPDGYLYVVGRTRDVVIRGGEKVYSAEVEAVLCEHADVVDAGVVGVPHPELGEEVAAVVQVTDAGAVAADDLAAFVADRLARFKVPRQVVVVTDPLPRSATGKLVRAALVALVVPPAEPVRPPEWEP